LEKGERRGPWSKRRFGQGKAFTKSTGKTYFWRKPMKKNVRGVREPAGLSGSARGLGKQT